MFLIWNAYDSAHSVLPQVNITYMSATNSYSSISMSTRKEAVAGIFSTIFLADHPCFPIASMNVPYLSSISPTLTRSISACSWKLATFNPFFPLSCSVPGTDCRVCRKSQQAWYKLRSNVVLFAPSCSSQKIK